MNATDWRSDGAFLAPGEMSTLDDCEREALHLMPAIQGVGAAIVVDDDDRVIARTASAGDLLGADVLGATAASLLGAPAVESVGRVGALQRSGRSWEVRGVRSRTGPIVVELLDVHLDGPLPTDGLAGLISDLSSARSVDELLRSAATGVRRLLGFDRVWVYRFDRDDAGEIVAEDRRDDLESFLGLRFGEGDIPAQARALYLEERVRVVRDTAAPAEPILPAPLPDGRWLDTSGLAIRAVSPIHVRYLRNMGVRASASLAIVHGGRLWGLISGHLHDRPSLPSAETERVARAISDLVSMQVGAMERAEAADRRLILEQHLGRVLAAVGAAESILGGLTDDPDALLSMVDSVGVVVRVAGRHRTFGMVPSTAAVDRLIGRLDRTMPPGGVVHVVESIAEWTDGSERTGEIAGLLAVSLARDVGNWIVWFRPEQLSQARWGDRRSLHDHDRLSPAGSFSIHAAEVAGRCHPWQSAEIEVASGLRSALGTVVFQRSEQLARNVEALRAANDELDRFAYVAAHDLKEPLRGIFNYVDFLREDHGDVLGEAGNALLDSTSRLSRRMAVLVDALLDYASIGRTPLRVEPLRLSALVDEAADWTATRMGQTGATIEVVDDLRVVGDRVQLVQVLTNLLSNAMKYRHPDRVPHVVVTVGGLGDTERGWDGWPQHQADIPPPWVISVADNGIGVPADQRTAVFEVFRRLHGRDEYGGGSGAGLTIARRIAERHGGDLWVEGRPGGGSVFHLAISRLLDEVPAP